MPVRILANFPSGRSWPSSFIGEEFHGFFPFECKTIFIEGDLNEILDIDERANKDLTRIIFDYAHERWAASRQIDPFFWRPVSNFLNEELLSDMKRLLESENYMENKAAALCLFNSDQTEAQEMLKQYPELLEKITNKTISWSSLKD